jgi:hypothetical protein
MYVKSDMLGSTNGHSQDKTDSQPSVLDHVLAVYAANFCFPAPQDRA